MRRSLCLLPLMLILTLLLTACAGNTVRLLFVPAEPGSLPAPSAKRVVVVMFDDKRPNQPLGTRRNGTTFTANSSIADWASRSLGDAVLRLGPQVSYATTLAEAKRAKPDYIITGVVREVWLQETGTATVMATIRLSISLSGSNGVVYSENLSSSQERKGVITSSDVENLLLDTLKDIVNPASRKIFEAIH